MGDTQALSINTDAIWSNAFVHDLIRKEGQRHSNWSAPLRAQNTKLGKELIVTVSMMAKPMGNVNGTWKTSLKIMDPKRL